MADRRAATAAVEVVLDAGAWELRGEIGVPTGPTTLTDLLPAARAVADAVVGETSAAVEGLGACVSCGPGCGACCRMLVNVSEVEARRLRAVVLAMPEPRRAEVLARFAAALRRLDSAGLLPALRRAGGLTPDQIDALTGEYFRLKIPCPFLEAESCSIYDERPVTCREYLVTSDPKHCAGGSAADVVRLQLPLKTFNALARWDVAPAAHFLERFVPLILALEWGEAHPRDPHPRPGVELFKEFVGLLREQIEPAAAGDEGPSTAGA
ncbi:YkgJ family cysteine cluster protein [Paludisphaera mucosa]|uniref:YkgJ family cysteine cluster protein n=1 Tax=Paludisphaera mucosa TaxID=3030827 RepID=A0ABT6FIM1_9BACT|nr:YkgJ family cysteine cluster protein [Paludisphaera mucosa]MDG3007384.1 YkgJ family cysteine cluster protein [Paludisphaera mucosa]